MYSIKEKGRNGVACLYYVLFQLLNVLYMVSVQNMPNCVSFTMLTITTLRKHSNLNKTIKYLIINTCTEILDKRIFTNLVRIS